MLPNVFAEQGSDAKIKANELNELVERMSGEQKAELKLYMDRIKQEYLMKILEQVNI